MQPAYKLFRVSSNPSEFLSGYHAVLSESQGSTSHPCKVFTPRHLVGLLAQAQGTNIVKSPRPDMYEGPHYVHY